MNNANITEYVQTKLGRAYLITSRSSLEVQHTTGLVGVFYVGTRCDGRTRTIFVQIADRS